ncbi:probable amino acid permease 7 [Phtheirospermum japonicum]|uniref:Probable amino acid permease 7 n=1 Tax=Phtheirospermum japonicum TaxID=374723 RepID=A0A830CJF1_9LAMI|nr:probable amino acid permease 7 [Phtheirospermum japonicum]
MGVITDSDSPPLLQSSFTSPLVDHSSVKRTGTIWTAVAHIITGVIGSGVLALGWSMAQYPDPEYGPIRNRSFTDAVRLFLGERSGWICGILMQISFYGTGIAYVITSAKCLSIGGISTSTGTQKVLLISQALGDIAFAYPYSMIALNIQDTLRSPPPESVTMKRASIYIQPVFATVDKWSTEKFHDSSFINRYYILKLPYLPAWNLNPQRLCFRTAYVASTTAVAMIFPYFNQVLGVSGAITFWPLAIYFPVEMWFRQKNIEAWTGKWIALRVFTIVCFVITMFALVGSIEGLIAARLS